MAEAVAVRSRVVGRGRIVGTTIVALARAFAVKPVAPRGRRSPLAGRWGLTAQRGPSKGGHHAINTEMRLAPRASLAGAIAAVRTCTVCGSTSILVSAEAKTP